MPRRERGGSEVVTIYWRDIPAQVNGQNGRERHQVLLSSKFQRAVDRAKRKAGIYTAEEDIAQWHRTSDGLRRPRARRRGAGGGARGRVLEGVPRQARLRRRVRRRHVRRTTSTRTN